MLRILKSFQVLGRALALPLLLALPDMALAQCQGLDFWDTLSDPQQAQIEARAAATPFATGNLWSATRGDTQITIVGTLHLPDFRHGDTLIALMPSLQTADLLLVEATLEDQTEMQTYMAQNPDLVTLPDGTTLVDKLDPATWDRITAAAAARGIPGFMVARMQPWFLSMTLAIPPCAMATMATGEGGLDNHIMDLAAAYDIPTEPLEPWQDLFALLSSGTFDEQIDALRLSLVEPWLQDAITVAITEAYFEGENARAWYLSDVIHDYLPDVDQATFEAQMAEVEAVLLTARNRNWIPVIEDAAATHDEIVLAFGAAHLFGENGVLHLLERDGWTITRLD